MIRTRAIQTPGESAQPADETDVDMDEASGAGGQDKAPASVDVEALQAEMARLRAENEALKAKPAKGKAGGTVVAGGHELTDKGWIVKEPPASPVKG